MITLGVHRRSGPTQISDTADHQQHNGWITEYDQPPIGVDDKSEISQERIEMCETKTGYGGPWPGECYLTRGTSRPHVAREVRRGAPLAKVFAAEPTA
jgi:hypothetical protein